MSEKTAPQVNAEEKLRRFLLANELRQTRERFAILRAVCQTDGLFTIEDLQKKMQEAHFRVSTSALYANTQLLVQANLLVRHPFSSSSALFERIYDDRPRSYQICNNCHRITLIKSRDFSAALQTYHPRRFATTHRIAYIYGVCPKCEAAMRKKLKNHEPTQETR